MGIPLGWYLSDHFYHSNDVRSPSPTEFVPYVLVKKEAVSSTCSIFTLQAKTNAVIDSDAIVLDRGLPSVEFKQPQLQIARSYTCLPPTHDQPVEELRFLIRKERKGEVSNYLHKLPLGATLDVRGPHVEFQLPEKVKSVVFLAGGTGIAPAMQVADMISDEAEVHILWANRRREDCVGGQNDTLGHNSSNRSAAWFSLGSRGSSAGSQHTGQLQRTECHGIASELDGLKLQSKRSQEASPRLRVDYFVDEERTSITPKTVTEALDTAASLSPSETSGRRLILVSGPPGFIEYWAGPKQWIHGRETQGPLRGALSKMDLAGFEVVKL